MTRRYGSGLLLAVAGIGSSHFLLAPTAGARFGTALAWTILVGHVIKYPAFRDATLYTTRTGRSVLEAFATLPGPRRWALWATLALLAVQVAFVIAGVTLVTVGVVQAAWPNHYSATIFVALVDATGVLLWTGRYHGLQRFSAWALAVMAVMTVIAVAVARPGDAIVVDTLVPQFPVASGVLIGALLGFMPAPLEIAVMKSLWTREQLREGRNETEQDAMFDLRLGYGASFVLAILLMALAARLLHPEHSDASNFDMLALLAEAYVGALGAFAKPLILGAAFLGMFSTVYAATDGYNRGIAGAWRGLWPKAFAGRDHAYWWTFYAVGLAALGVMLWLPDPVAVVSLAANTTILLAPLWAGLLLWVVWREPVARGGRHELWTSVAALAALVAVAVAVLATLDWSLCPVAPTLPGC